MENQPKTRVSLIIRLRHPDDAAAWHEFVEIYQPLVFRLARKKGLQEADALDTTQEVLTRVAKAINRWDPDPEKGSFRGWLSRITRNLVIEFLRRKNRQPLTSDNSSIDELIRSTPHRLDDSLESQMFDLEEQRQIFAWAAEKVRSTVQEKSWQAFWLTAVENQTADSVSCKLDMTRGAIYIAKSRVMAKLKSIVNQHIDAETSGQSHLERTNPFFERNER